ncbi:NFX1-type zinc finger-containing protein 1-like [Trichoplusia ni]|uniref:NFX1-type zinc finger-containing protein 1-like n=1 Tax=Trichoplusia ni TaxID=7111 RepID=A0A7E5X077_TRINI|nr:NFX1-type zinc finger-containing protein 1-like [Trichoplusia ni]
MFSSRGATGPNRCQKPRSNYGVIQPIRQSGEEKSRDYKQRTKYIPFKTLEDIARGDAQDALQKINNRREAFMNIVGSPIDKHDIFVLVIEILSKVSSSPFVELKCKLILDVCNSDFIPNLRNYLTDLPYVNNKKNNNLYWNDQDTFWKNFITFFGELVTIAPSVASKKCRALIDSVSKTCLEFLNQNHAFELSQEYTLKLDEIRNEMTTFSNKYQAQVDSYRNRGEHINQDMPPPENFRILSIVPTRDDLMDSTPFVRPNIVQGAYNDVEHYLDVQFRLLREDCFGPIRDGIKQFLREPNKRKYDNVRIFHNVKFICPYVANLKMGAVVQIDLKSNRHFKKINWAHNKRFLFGSLVLFTKDNCKSFIAATIVDRDVNLLSNGKVGSACRLLFYYKK